MSITVFCRSCDARLRVEDQAGEKVKCPRCGRFITVPEEEVEDRPRRKRSREEEEDEEDRPRRKQRAGKKRSRKGLIIGLLIGGGVLLAGGPSF
jgi:DNA-directed RNA polymerase subunit M/transcription elongation factor TFIIS